MWKRQDGLDAGETNQRRHDDGARTKHVIKTTTDCGADTGNLRIDFREFVDYVRPRINVLLQAVNTALDQTVWPSSEGEDLIVTELAPPPALSRGATTTPRAATPGARGGGGAAARGAASA